MTSTILKVGTVTAEAVSADRAMAAMNGTVDAACDVDRRSHDFQMTMSNLPLREI